DPALVKKKGTFKPTNNVNIYLAKFDHRLSSLHLLSARYSFSRNYAENATNFGLTNTSLENNGTEQDYTHIGILALNSTLSSSMLNEFRTHFSHESRPRVNNGEADDFISKVGPETRIIGCCTLGGIAILPITQHDNTWQIADNLSFINGRHNVKLGVDLNRTSVSQVFRGNWRGLYIFTTLENYLRVVSHETNPITGSPYPADFLRIFFGNGQFRGNFWDVGSFAQDSIRLNSRLSIYLGLRYEAAPMPQPPAPNPLLPFTEAIPGEAALAPYGRDSASLRPLVSPGACKQPPASSRGAAYLAPC